MGFRNIMWRAAALETYLNRMSHASASRASGSQTIGDFMRRRVIQRKMTIMRPLAIPYLLILLGLGGLLGGLLGGPFGPAPAVAQSSDSSGKPAANAPADAAKDNQRKTAEFVEATQAINGPAGNPECVWLGRRVVRLMWVDDLDTAFRHLDLYDRFGCPGGHVQAAFRCLTRFGDQIDDKVPRSLDTRIQACWINPAAQPQPVAAAAPAAAASPAPAASATPAAAPPSPAPSPTPTPAPTASPQPPAK
jgi:cell division septation protein DedD